MVHGYHLIMGAYGFWLPNDPRGSWSEFVGSYELARYGRATKTNVRYSVAAAPHDRSLRQAAKKSLKYPAVLFNGVQARAVGRGFGAYRERSQLTILACAILPDHVHLVVARHRLDIEQIANFLKGEATRQLVSEQIHPMAKMPTRSGRPPKAFARGQWSVYLDSDEDIRRAIRYVERNPIKEDLPAQHWRFITPYTGLSMP